MESRDSEREEAQWKSILDDQIEEQHEKSRLFHKARPVFLALCALIPLYFFVQTRSHRLLRERMMERAALQTQFGVSKVAFKRWAAHQNYIARRETSDQVTIDVPNKYIGLPSGWAGDNAVEVTAHFDSRANLTTFDQPTPTRITAP